MCKSGKLPRGRGAALVGAGGNAERFPSSAAAQFPKPALVAHKVHISHVEQSSRSASCEPMKGPGPPGFCAFRRCQGSAAGTCDASPSDLHWRNQRWKSADAGDLAAQPSVAAAAGAAAGAGDAADATGRDRSGVHVRPGTGGRGTCRNALAGARVAQLAITGGAVVGGAGGGVGHLAGCQSGSPWRRRCSRGTGSAGRASAGGPTRHGSPGHQPLARGRSTASTRPAARRRTGSLADRLGHFAGQRNAQPGGGRARSAAPLRRRTFRHSNTGPAGHGPTARHH